MGRIWHEVRVREKRPDGSDVKKSKFYCVKGPREAARKYKGGGLIMWISKVAKEKQIGEGVGEFFRLGDDLLKELRQEASLQERVKNKRRGYYERKRKEATN